MAYGCGTASPSHTHVYTQTQANALLIKTDNQLEKPRKLHSYSVKDPSEFSQPAPGLKLNL